MTIRQARRAALRLAAGVLLVPATIGAQALPDSAMRQVDEIFRAFDTRTSPGCVVGVGRDGQAVVAKGYGMANLEYNVPLTANSVMESGSVAKQFTAAALVLLQLDGKLSLDDDVRRYVPGLPDFGTPITIRHLLTHTSGLRDQWALLGTMGRPPGSEVHTTAEILDLVARQRELNFPVGSEYLYSNTGYTLAGVIVTRVSGMPFAKFSEERLFKPLGMTHTQWRDDYRRIVPGRATAYAYERGAWVQDMPFTMIHGNGGLLSTIGDLLRWNDALTNGFPGHPQLTQLLETRGRLTSGRTLSYALGLTVGDYAPGIREVGHSGSTAGYRTYMARYPEARVSVAVWCNAATANPTALARRVVALFLPRAAAPARAPASVVAAAERERIAGTYRDPRTDDFLAIGAVGDHVRIIGPSSDSLRAGDGGKYTTPSGYTLTFLPASGKANRLRVETSEADAREMELVTAPSSGALQLDAYAGSYLSPELGSRIVVAVDNGRLTARLSPDNLLMLAPIYTDGFRVGGAGQTVRFVREAGGRVTGLRVFAGRARNLRFDREG